MKTTHNYFSREAAQALIGQYAINSLERIEGCLHWLSQTFRFGNGLARHIAGQVNGAYALLGEQKTIRIRGTPENTLFGRTVELGHPLVIIARSNLALFETCLKHTFGGDLRFYFEGGYSGHSFMNARVASLFYLMEGRKEKVIDPFVRRFASFEEARHFASETQNSSLSTMIQLARSTAGSCLSSTGSSSRGWSRRIRQISCSRPRTRQKVRNMTM